VSANVHHHTGIEKRNNNKNLSKPHARHGTNQFYHHLPQEHIAFVWHPTLPRNSLVEIEADRLMAEIETGRN